MYVASTATAQTKQKQKTKTAGVQDGPALPATIIVLWRNYVGDFRLVEFAQQCSLEVPKERKKARLTLAPNRGCHGVLWTYSGSVVVLSWDLTHKNTQTSTQAHLSRHTSSLDTNTRGSPRPRIKHVNTFAQRHKSDKNIPVNLAKTATAALPFPY